MGKRSNFNREKPRVVIGPRKRERSVLPLSRSKDAMAKAARARAQAFRGAMLAGTSGQDVGEARRGELVPA